MTALTTLQSRAPGFQPDIAVVLGSGWGGLTAHIAKPVRIAYADLEGFPQATVAGHSGELWLGTIGDSNVAVMSGRKHGYETGAVDGMKVPLQTLRALGCRVLVQTNAAGSVRSHIPPQSLMLITDHLNLPQRSPLVGENGSERFVGLADAYDPLLRQQALLIAAQHKQPLHQGVYAWFFGPHFETPAEIRMAQLLGADAVGMSTVPETILARYMGLKVLALSLITNMGAGLSSESLSHAHTLQQAQAASDRASSLLATVIAGLQLEESPTA